MERVSEIKTVVVSETVTLASGGTTGITSNEIDTLGYDFLQVVVLAGTMAASSGISVFKLQSATTSGGSFSDYTGAATAADPLSATDDDKRAVINVDLRGKDRFWKAVVTTAESGNSAVTVIANLGKAHKSPAADNDLAAVAYA